MWMAQPQIRQDVVSLKCGASETTRSPCDAELDLAFPVPI